MARLNKEREQKKEPKRLEYAKNELEHLGFVITYETDKELKFEFLGHQITLYPYSGWYTGKGIKDGRGLTNLLNQLKPNQKKSVKKLEKFYKFVKKIKQ